jgi:hypothetical protein
MAGVQWPGCNDMSGRLYASEHCAEAKCLTLHSMSTTHDPRQSHLLAALPAADLERLRSDLKLILAIPRELGNYEL